MKECMRELKAYKAAMQSLPSGCLAAEAEAEKQEKLSVEMTGSQTGPMSCSEQTELFVRASGQKTGMVYTQKLDANASDVIAQALTNSEASAAKKAEPMAAADYWEMDEAKDSNYEQTKTLASIETLKNKAKTLAGQLEESFGCQVRLNLSQTILTMGIVNTNNIEETASVCRFAAEAAADGYEEMVLDPLLPMESAIRLYRRNGFEEISAYYENPMDDVLYFRRALTPSQKGEEK